MSNADDELEPVILEALVLGLPDAGRPGPSLRDRLLERVGGRDRFLPFVGRVCDLFDLSEADAEAQLRSVEQVDAWDDMLPGIRFRDFEGGPALGDAHGGFVRIAPGTIFPHHTHVGEERVLVLQGRLRDEAGTEYRAGDMIVSGDGSAHRLEAIGDREAIYMASVVALQFTEGDDQDDQG